MGIPPGDEVEDRQEPDRDRRNREYRRGARPSRSGVRGGQRPGGGADAQRQDRTDVGSQPAPAEQQREPSAHAGKAATRARAGARATAAPMPSSAMAESDASSSFPIP